MGENSSIEWTDHTFNPWVGCTKVSDGCKNCYAETLMDKRMGFVEWGVRGDRRRTSPSNWRKPILWNRKAREAGKRARVFCSSLADIFEVNPHQDLYPWRHDLMELIRDTPWLDWLLLTKRPEEVMDYFHFGWATDIPENIWLGTSVENQQTADERIPHLVEVPVVVKFLSVEPLLGPVDLQLRGLNYGRDFGHYREAVEWVILGGESGHNARPMNPGWAISVKDQAIDADVPFFFKQWGEWNDQGQKVGKKAAGRVLAGKTWDEFPVIAC